MLNTKASIRSGIPRCLTHAFTEGSIANGYRARPGGQQLRASEKARSLIRFSQRAQIFKSRNKTPAVCVRRRQQKMSQGTDRPNRATTPARSKSRLTDHSGPRAPPRRGASYGYRLQPDLLCTDAPAQTKNNTTKRRARRSRRPRLDVLACLRACACAPSPRHGDAEITICLRTSGYVGRPPQGPRQEMKKDLSQNFHSTSCSGILYTLL